MSGPEREETRHPRRPQFHVGKYRCRVLYRLWGPAWIKFKLTWSTAMTIEKAYCTEMERSSFHPSSRICWPKWLIFLADFLLGNQYSIEVFFRKLKYISIGKIFRSRKIEARKVSITSHFQPTARVPSSTTVHLLEATRTLSCTRVGYNALNWRMNVQ